MCCPQRPLPPNFFTASLRHHSWQPQIPENEQLRSQAIQLASSIQHQPGLCFILHYFPMREALVASCHRPPPATCICSSPIQSSGNRPFLTPTTLFGNRGVVVATDHAAWHVQVAAVVSGSSGQVVHYFIHYMLLCNGTSRMITVVIFGCLSQGNFSLDHQQVHGKTSQWLPSLQYPCQLRQASTKSQWTALSECMNSSVPATNGNRALEV